MKLVLISPLGDLNCDIAISDFPYDVGRNCRDFDAKAYCSGLFGAAISQVSSRHGVFTLESNQVVLEDLSSTNGTTVNGKSITGQKRTLYPGDRINFAGKLEFIVDIEYPPLELPEGKSFSLNPVAGGSELDSFQLNALPFLIGRLSPVFRKYDGLVPKSCAPLANRHARIFFKDGHVYIADLGSQSGIVVQGTPVKSGRARIDLGCDLKFTNFFHYSMTAVVPGHQVAQPAPAAAVMTASSSSVADEDRTIYFDESTTFMSVVSENDFNTALAEETESAGCAGQPTAKSGFKFDPKLVVGACVVLLALSLSVFWYLGSDTKKVNRLLSQNQYEQGLQEANAALADDGEDQEMLALASKALSLGLIQEYVRLMTAGQDQELLALLAKYRDLTSHFSEGGQVVSLFSYLHEIEQFARTKRKSGSLEYFFDVDEVRDDVPRLMKQWRVKKYEYKMLLDQLVITEPLFNATRKQFYTSINHLHKIESNELPAIIKLESQIKQYLGAGMIDKVQSLLGRFESSYAHVDGDERWRSDLAKLKKMVALKDQGDVYEALDIAEKSPMTTSLFRDLVKNWQKRNLPDQKVFQAVVKSRSLWKAGNSGRAIAELEVVSVAASSGELVKETLAHYQEVIKQYQFVMGGGGSTCSALADFYGLLTVGDTYYKNQFQNKYAACAKRARIEISDYVQKGNGLYLSYMQLGGISGIMRMEDSLSKGFEKQAAVLVQAYDFCQQARRQSGLYSLTLAGKELEFVGVVEKEYEKQRMRLMENRALSPVVLQQKMNAITWKGERR